MSTDQTPRGPNDVVWVKSSYSGSNGGECIEVASVVSTIHVRDSKNPNGPKLSFAPSEWAAFVELTTEGHGGKP